MYVRARNCVFRSVVYLIKTMPTAFLSVKLQSQQLIQINSFVNIYLLNFNS